MTLWKVFIFNGGSEDVAEQLNNHLKETQDKQVYDVNGVRLMHISMAVSSETPCVSIALLQLLSAD